MSETRNEFDHDSAVYRTLLESTRAIPWKIDWATMKFAYIGPQIEPLLGWSQDSWLTAEDWAMRIHPEDREHVVNFCISQSKAGVDHEADYRALIGFMFDISERKKAEEKLISLQKELEALSFKDGLTGVSNRRRFDAALDIEWANARRSTEPLSLIMLDVDFFKQYNDRYGHAQGDECLKSVAQALAMAVTRPRDIVARFGGEEFALILPETDADAASKVAERCLRLIENQRIPHAASAISKFVTVSMGVATIEAAAGMEARHFVAAVDKLLYQAKRNGRNRIESASL